MDIAWDEIVEKSGGDVAEREELSEGNEVLLAVGLNG